MNLSALQDEIHKDFIYPQRRPLGLPLPTVLWSTSQGCAALWRMTKTMGLSQGLDTGDVIACVLENDDFFPSNQQYLQLPYTVGWPTVCQLDNGQEAGRLSIPKPFNICSSPAEHDWDSFRRLIKNADEVLAEYDD